LSKLRRNAKQKVFAAAAVAAVIAGGASAAVSATGQGNGQRRIHARHGVHRLHQRDLTAAAGYLGISTEQLEHELNSSGSLGQVAQAHGKSTQGLIDSIVAARKARLTEVAARLPSRVGAEVNGPARLPHAAAAGSLRLAAGGYLGIAPSQLRDELRSGRTLAQIADATPGKSSAGLRDALVAARKVRLAQGVAAGKIPQARAARREKRLDKRMSALLQRKFLRTGKP
jgi:uncharacterized membrane protein